jgi:GrpB-like predicted nucleotidyltransferase (UPF0157 family)
MSSRDIPQWAVEPITIRSHDPAWIESGRAECERLGQLLAPWLVDGVEHVGSTAVPGLAAKPIVDLIASVRDLKATTVDPARDLLVGNAWAYVPPELDERSWRRFFAKPDEAGRRPVAHLHLIPAGHTRWFDLLAFRDLLRHDAELAARYGSLKYALAQRYTDDREAYTDAKARFVSDALGTARRSSSG